MNSDLTQASKRKGDIFSRPACILEAGKTSKPRHLLVEILIFILIFIIFNTLTSVILIFPMIFYMFTSDAFRELISDAATGSINSEAIEKLTDIAVNLPDWLLILQLFAFVAAIATAIFYCTKIEKRRLFTMGFSKRGKLSEYVIGLIAGAAAFTLAVLICWITGTLDIKGLATSVAPLTLIFYFLGFMVQGMGEEVLCRGYLMVSVSRNYTLPVAILANSLAFSALHLLNSGITLLSLINLTLFGIFASIYFIKRGSIWGIAAFHSVWNFVQGNFFGIKVSGTSISASVFESELTDTGTLINGGSFGLEGGLAVTLVLVIGIAILYFMKPKKEPAVSYPPAGNPPADKTSADVPPVYTPPTAV